MHVWRQLHRHSNTVSGDFTKGRARKTLGQLIRTLAFSHTSAPDNFRRKSGAQRISASTLTDTTIRCPELSLGGRQEKLRRKSRKCLQQLIWTFAFSRTTLSDSFRRLSGVQSTSESSLPETRCLCSPLQEFVLVQFIVSEPSTHECSQRE